ncbi:MAG: hypothetical protein U9N80_04500 [Chloroflexota bacterium]|nr:hypothetical protein [Chloroflexota bacterium]
MEDNPAHNRFFIYPQVQKKDEIQTVIASMETFRQSLGETDRDLVGILISYVEAHSSRSHLLPHLTPFEFVLLTMLIEQQREIASQKNTPDEPEQVLNHPPFP